MQGSGNANVACLQLAACSLSVFLENNVSQLMTPLCRPTWNANKVFNHLAAETKTLNTCAGRGEEVEVEAETEMETSSRRSHKAARRAGQRLLCKCSCKAHKMRVATVCG